MFTHKDIEFRTIFVINCLKERNLRVSNGELLLEEVIEHNIDQLFLKYDVICAHPFRIMRNADLSIDEDEAVEKLGCWNKELIPGAELSRLCVRKDVQNRGIAKEMMRHVFDVLKKEGKKSVHILVKTGHKAALSSYGALGFQIVGECNLFDKDFICMEIKI